MDAHGRGDAVHKFKTHLRREKVGTKIDRESRQLHKLEQQLNALIIVKLFPTKNGILHVITEPGRKDFKRQISHHKQRTHHQYDPKIFGEFVGLGVPQCGRMYHGLISQLVEFINQDQIEQDQEADRHKAVEQLKAQVEPEITRRHVSQTRIGQVAATCVQFNEHKIVKLVHGVEYEKGKVLKHEEHVDAADYNQAGVVMAHLVAHRVLLRAGRLFAAHKRIDDAVNRKRHQQPRGYLAERVLSPYAHVAERHMELITQEPVIRKLE